VRVLEAALELIGERGIESTSVDAIAQRSGVSKATIYKHWNGKDELCVEAISHRRGEVIAPHSPDVRADISSFLQVLGEVCEPEGWGRIWARVMGYAAENPEFAAAFRRHVAEPRRAVVRSLLSRARDEGRLEPSVDIDMGVDLLLGPVFHRRFLGLPITADYVDYVVASYWRAHSA
jgi:AcrR family transcriptional regulator